MGRDAAASDGDGLLIFAFCCCSCMGAGGREGVCKGYLGNVGTACPWYHEENHGQVSRPCDPFILYEYVLHMSEASSNWRRKRRE